MSNLFLDKTFSLVDNYINAYTDSTDSLSINFPKNEFEKKLQLQINDQGASQEDLLTFIKYLLENSVKTLNPRFNNQLFSGLDPVAVAGDLLTAITNTTMTTYEASPIGTIMEEKLIEYLNNIIGFTTKESKGEGIMTSGGSQANMLGMICARNKVNKDIKNSGVNSDALVCFVSEDSHYSFSKMANVIGVGMNNVINVATNGIGQMDIIDLDKKIKKAIKQGKKPFMIGATSGTTVYGAFDPIDDIAKVAKRYNLWLHADGAWGGPVIFSKKNRHLIKGLEKADSFSLDAHKLLGVPLTATFFLVKENGTLLTNFNEDVSEYLFHDDDNEEINLGRKSIQCGRRFDALKVWLSWKEKGFDGLERLVDRNIEKARKIYEYVISIPEFEVLNDPRYLNVCFRVKIPTSVSDHNATLLRVRQKLIENNDFFINYSKDKEGKLFFRLVVINPEAKLQDYFLLVDKILKYTKEKVTFVKDYYFKPAYINSFTEAASRKC